MPTCSISVINQNFESRDDQEVPSLEAALTEAIKGALHIGVAEVGAGNSYCAAEVRIDGDGEKLARYVVSIGVS